MGKSKRGDKERSREQELKYENNRLRREVGSLRKQLARLDLDRYSQVRDIVQEHYANETEESDNAKLLNDLKQVWACKECNAGHLEIILYNKVGETWYFRQCSRCFNRTKAQKYTPSVKGIIKNAEG